ncbi:MAG: HD domain-containing protein [Lachnospiraceae bacterium]|nr:HD domain-containing protein [Lachnospiraceae bacterium]
MYTNEQDEAFYEMIWAIIETDEFKKMREYKHHIYGNTYEHSIRVAYLCFLHYHRFQSKVNLEELVRGALLHDYFLYNRHDKSQKEHVNGLIHGFTHPRKALNNALAAYPDLTNNEQDMIARHMFPLTPLPPKTRYGWMVCFYDKVSAIAEYCNKIGAESETVLYRVKYITNSSKNVEDMETAKE